MDPLVEESIIACLEASPASIEELIYGLPKIPPGRIRPAVRELVAAGAIVKVPGRTDEGRAVYALADYREDAGWVDHSDLVWRCDYGAHYTPTWPWRDLD